MRIDEGLGHGRHSAAARVGDSRRRYQCDAWRRGWRRWEPNCWWKRWRRLAERRLQATPQDHARATLAPILTREDGRIDFSRDAQTICNRHRGFQPWPGAFTTFRGKQLTLHAISVPSDAPGWRPARSQSTGEQLLAGCGEGTAIVIDELQLEGKRRMKAREFINGYQPKAGEKLGS